MNISDVFNELMQGDHGGNSYDHLYHYWALEVMIANSAGHPHSMLEDFQNPDDRKCGLCGTIGRTSDWGDSVTCKHEVCVSARKFWGMRDFKRPLPIGGPSVARSQWFRKKLFDQFGEKQIYKIPEGHRLSTGLALQLLRISAEKHDESIGQGFGKTNCTSEQVRQKDEQGDCTACLGVY